MVTLGTVCLGIPWLLFLASASAAPDLAYPPPTNRGTHSGPHNGHRLHHQSYLTTLLFILTVLDSASAIQEEYNRGPSSPGTHTHPTPLLPPRAHTQTPTPMPTTCQPTVRKRRIRDTITSANTIPVNHGPHPHHCPGKQSLPPTIRFTAAPSNMSHQHASPRRSSRSGSGTPHHTIHQPTHWHQSSRARTRRSRARGTPDDGRVCVVCVVCVVCGVWCMVCGVRCAGTQRGLKQEDSDIVTL
jgi:hypothetical protein